MIFILPCSRGFPQSFALLVDLDLSLGQLG